jgi:membrane protease YdiL (CAAX protease family)
VFALFHLASVDLSSHPVIILTLMVQLFIVGVILARMVQRSGRLGSAIFTHAGFNLVAVIALLVAPELAG